MAGRFQKGESGNPGGRPKQTTEQKDALEKIRSLCPKAVEEMEKILTSPKAGASLKLEVIKMILERTYGKPSQPVEVSGEPICIVDDVTGAAKSG